MGQRLSLHASVGACKRCPENKVRLRHLQRHPLTRTARAPLPRIVPRRLHCPSDSHRDTSKATSFRSTFQLRPRFVKAPHFPYFLGDLPRAGTPRGYRWKGERKRAHLSAGMRSHEEIEYTQLDRKARDNKNREPKENRLRRCTTFPKGRHRSPFFSPIACPPGFFFSYFYLFFLPHPFALTAAAPWKEQKTRKKILRKD